MNLRTIETKLATDQRLWLLPITPNIPEVVLASNGIPLSLKINQRFDRKRGTNVYAIAMTKEEGFEEHTVYIRSEIRSNINKIIYGYRPRTDFFHAHLDKTKKGEFDGFSQDLGGMTENQDGNTIRNFRDAIARITEIPEYESYFPSISLMVTKWLSPAELSIHSGGNTPHIILTLPQAHINVTSGKEEVGEFIYPADTTTIR